MNKIFLLKLLIAFITLLIFLTLGGIVYALANYKTTPKLFSRNKAPVVRQEKQPSAEIPADTVTQIHLGLKKGEQIDGSHACGNMLCLQISSDFEGNKIVIFDPVSLQIKAVLDGGKASASR